jgi:hypothetical protein
MINFPANDPPAEAYFNTRATPPTESLRWWVRAGAGGADILGGGSVVDGEDWKHLSLDFGVTHVLNLDSKSDTGIVPAERLAEIAVVDNGMAIAAQLLNQCCAFAKQVYAAHGQVLYVHSGNGGARAPAIVYAILRGVFGFDHESALVAVNQGFPHSQNFHWGYLDGHRCAIGSVDLWIDEGGLGA